MSQVAISAPAHPPILDDEYARRFGGVARLYGPQALERFAAAHVCVIGIGGVGSWVAEAVARCGVGKFTLIDLDHIAVSNTNRQIHALGENGDTSFAVLFSPFGFAKSFRLTRAWYRRDCAIRAHYKANRAARLLSRHYWQLAASR